MPRVSIQQMAATKDPLQTWNWEVLFPRIPGVQDTRALTVRAISTSLPGSQIEQASWEGHGKKLNFGGRLTFSGTWDCTFIEARDSSTRDALVGWRETVRSWKKNSGTYKEEHAVIAELTLYDAADRPSKTIKMFNCFPTNIGDVSLDNSSSVMQIQCTLSFDWIEE